MIKNKSTLDSAFARSGERRRTARFARTVNAAPSRHHKQHTRAAPTPVDALPDTGGSKDKGLPYHWHASRRDAVALRDAVTTDPHILT